MDKQEQEPASSELSNSDNVFNSEIKQSSELSEKPEDTKLAEKNDTPSTNVTEPTPQNQKEEEKAEEKKLDEQPEEDGNDDSEQKPTFAQEEDIRNDGNYYLPHYKISHWESVKRIVKPLAEGRMMKLGTFPKHIIKKILDETADIEVSVNGLGAILEELDKDMQETLIKKTLPFIGKLVLRTPEIFPQSYIKFLFFENLEPLVLKKEQVACLLAHMFLCSNIKHKFDKKGPPIPGDINFLGFYNNSAQDPVKIGKIMCILNYFTRLATEGIPDQDLVFQRLNIDTSRMGKCSHKDWVSLDKPFQEVEICYEGKIEDAENAIEIDFANKYLGGGVLRHGMVQEEIMFTVAPECLVGILFNHVMEDNEAILIQGAQTYCSYKGYGDTFRYEGNFVDNKPPSDINPRIFNREIVAIDAIPFKSSPSDQYDSKYIIRELNKAYIGFFGGTDLSKERKSISTGRWGCGVFKGDPQLKFLLQWIAASRAQRKMKFYCFGAKDLNNIDKVVEKFKSRAIGDVVKLALGYAVGKGKARFFDYLLS